MKPTAVVLAAGLGTRMRSPLPKVLHPLAGRPMVEWIARSLQEGGADVILVVHHHEELVRTALAHLDLRYARQAEPRGTGDAVRSALSLLPESGPVMVTAGDTPLLTAASVRRLLAAHRGEVTVAAFAADDPTGYGRMVPGVGIVEDTACTPEERAIRTVNSGLYVFDAAFLRARLPGLQPHAPKQELWITDLVGPDANVITGFAPGEFMGVNDRGALAEARGLLARRINRAWAALGVDFESLDHALVEAEVALEPGASVGYGAVIRGQSRIGGQIGEHCVVVDSTVAAGARVLSGSVCEGAVVAAGAVVGPLARLRPGAIIEADARVGNFVEVKNSTLGPGAKANHLAYLGDATVGAHANVGAGTITCNYDGVRKHRTAIGAGAFIGSNTALVAPVTIGEGAIIGAGTTVTQDVPADAIAVGRPELKVLRARAERLRARYRALKEAGS